MKLYMDCVDAFHQKMGLPQKLTFETHGGQDLIRIGNELLSFAEQLADTGVAIEYRASHLLEELGEMLVAMGKGDELEAVDGLVDLLYISIGTACVFDWPLDWLFGEVHRSNMTKTGNSTTHPKKDGWVAPDIKRVLAAYRKGLLRPEPDMIVVSETMLEPDQIRLLREFIDDLMTERDPEELNAWDQTDG